jgi:hypothetical protein
MHSKIAGQMRMQSLNDLVISMIKNKAQETKKKKRPPKIKISYKSRELLNKINL